MTILHSIDTQHFTENIGLGLLDATMFTRIAGVLRACYQLSAWTLENDSHGKRETNTVMTYFGHETAAPRKTSVVPGARANAVSWLLVHRNMCRSHASRAARCGVK